MKVQETNLDATLSQLAATCEQASARSEPVFKQALSAKQLTKDSLREAGEAAHEIVKEVREDIYGRLGDVCDFYLATSDSQRSRLRESVADHSHPLRYYVFDYAGWCSRKIKSPHDTQWMKRGLAALSIENCGTDWRDTLVALGEIYIKAHRLGMAVGEELRHTASISSASPPYRNSGLNGGTKRFLEEFEHSAFYRQNVKPKLEISTF